MSWVPKKTAASGWPLSVPIWRASVASCFGPVGVPGDLRSRGPVGRCALQLSIGWSSCSANDPMISRQRSSSSISPAGRRTSPRHMAAQEEKDRVPEALGPHQRVGRPGQGLLEQSGHQERDDRGG